MEVVNEVMPQDMARIEAMQEQGPDGPIIMVNLLKFRDRAEYADGSDAHLTGREAYARYGNEVSKLLVKFGGRAIFAGDVSFLALGQVETLWDEIALAEYPDRAALWAMSTSPEWQAISHHRAAGLAGQLNIETTYAAGFRAADFVGRVMEG
ncbi:MAG TPA: DUF1330 domain-containing protein [Pseudomonadales bacterium]|nr:DUF1330 domain-containing protein [Pseudomonadales bacterium]